MHVNGIDFYYIWIYRDKHMLFHPYYVNVVFIN